MQYLNCLWGLLLQLWCEEIGDWLVFHRFAECLSDVDIVRWFLEVFRDWFVVGFKTIDEQSRERRGGERVGREVFGKIRLLMVGSP